MAGLGRGRCQDISRLLNPWIS